VEKVRHGITLATISLACVWNRDGNFPLLIEYGVPGTAL
jgi:hypothetical protein